MMIEPIRAIDPQNGSGSTASVRIAPLGPFSILLQGGLSKTNLAATANACRHWRELFPEAELILSISVTDAVTGDLGADRRLLGIQLVPHLREDGLLQVALATITEACDRIVLSPGALPLPKIKFDSGENNLNLQIAAASEGLKHVTRDYVLRARSDFLFLSDAFLTQYEVLAAAPRLDAARLTQRVLISESFTLNPFTLERMPLHFSDWFHFGLTEDVRRLWDVAPMRLMDAVHYASHPHPAHANPAERLFLTRLAPEQHLALEAFKGKFPALHLENHVDPTSVDLAMEILLDNFVVCDLRACEAYFPKYKWALVDGKKNVHCITNGTWQHLVHNRGIDHRRYFEPRTRAAERMLVVRYDPRVRPFKRPVARLLRLGRWARQVLNGFRAAIPRRRASS